MQKCCVAWHLGICVRAIGDEGKVCCSSATEDVVTDVCQLTLVRSVPVWSAKPVMHFLGKGVDDFVGFRDMP